MENAESAADPSVELLRHLAFERVSPQWSGFLRVLGDSLQTQLSESEFQLFMKRLGERFAQDHPLGQTQNLPELEAAINRFWADRQWGFAKLGDLGGALRIEHWGSPLPAALQVDAEVGGAFLEGVYGGWLSAAGAPPELTVGQAPSSGLPMHISFELKAAG